MKNQSTPLIFLIAILFALSMLSLSVVDAIKCFCLTDNGGDTPTGLNRLACQRANHEFHPDGCYVASDNGCAVPPRGREIDELIRECKVLGPQWSQGYLNCRC